MAEDVRPTLEVREREERGSRAARRLRRSGLVPGILYGGANGDSVSLSVGARELRNALQTGAALFDLKLDGQTPRPVIVKDRQQHPVREELLHIDFLEVRLDEKIQSTVSIELTNSEEAPGVKEGGVLEHITRELNIEALPTDIPERIVVDVSDMEPAATKSLAEIAAPAGVTFLDEVEETVIATISMPSEIVEEPEVEEETELVGEEGEPLAEGEEPPEGEAAEGEGEAKPEGEGEGSGGDSGGDKS
jgi:large subunit ribosomal protein L25